jgi:hypothetical protein
MVNEGGSDRVSPVLLVCNNRRIVRLPANKTFGIEDGVFRIGVKRVFGTIADSGRSHHLVDTIRDLKIGKRRLTDALHY